MQNKSSSNTYLQPELKTFSWAVSDYFTRDKNEKNAANIAMILSQLDQNDIWQFTERLIVECSKYDDKKLNKLKVELSASYYGNGKLPDLDGEISLYHLKSDALDVSGRPRIRGVIDQGEIVEYLPWSVWQEKKREATIKVLNVGAQIISIIDRINNFNPKLRSDLDLVRKAADKLKKKFECDVKELVDHEYIDNDDKRSFTRDKTNFYTFRRESPDPEKKKFKVYSRDYFYNLQILISQVFNSNSYVESMFHLSRVSTFIESKMFTRSNNKLFVVGPKQTELFKEFVELVHQGLSLNSLTNNHQYFTQDERLELVSTENYVRGVLMYCGTKMMSLVNYILTIIPYEKRSKFGRASLD